MKPWLSLLRDTLAAVMIFLCLQYKLTENWLWVLVYAAIYLGLSAWVSSMPHRKGWKIWFAAKVPNYLVLSPIGYGILLITLIRDAAFGWTLAAITIAGIVIGDRKQKPNEQAEGEITA